MASPQLSRAWLTRLALPIVLLVAVVGVLVYVNRVPMPPASSGQALEMPTSDAIEGQYGVRFTQVGITADGGMVDLRYRVLDPDKAMGIMNMAMSGGGDNPNAPKLIVEGDGTAIDNSEVMSMKQLPEPNSVQFVLFANPRGVLKSGMFVTIVVGDQRLEHVPVQ